MSAEALEKLSIGDKMVTTRAGAARARQVPLQQFDRSSSSSPEASPTPSLIESDDGHVYDVSTFDDDLRRRAKRGLMDDNEISMKFCKEIDDGSKQYVFHLYDDITVAVHADGAPKCSCGANEPGKACKHIFWMLGQLTATAPIAQPLQIDKDGSSVRNIHPAAIIERFSLETIASNLDWIYQEDAMPEEDQMLDEIANMLSVFEPTEALPSEFKRDEPSDLSERSQKYRELRSILTEHAIRNPALFMQLQEIVPPTFQTQIFFDKINQRIDRTFQALDEYVQRGPTNTPSEALDVRNCATRLKALVQAIDDYYHEHPDEAQMDDEPSTTSMAGFAATSLLRILDEVTRRDYDAYASIAWGPMPPTKSRENNLFVCLMRSTPESEGLFVLTTLLNLPHDVMLRHHAELLDIEERLAASPHTPPAYVDALRTFLHDNRKRAASESGGGTPKRAMT